jgi:hypothetical protein
MELHVVYDKSGTILAASRTDAGSLRPNGDRVPAPRPVPRRGQFAATVPVPEGFAARDLVDICTQLVVDVRAREKVLTPRQSGTRRSPAKRQTRR